MATKLQLEDIILPPPVSALSVSLLLLAAVLLILLLAVAFWLYRRYQRRRFCRAALTALAALDDDAIASLTPVNQLLKQVIRAYHPAFTAATHGDAWYALLCAQLPTRQRASIAPLQALADARRFQVGYRSGFSSTDIRAAAKTWLQHCRISHRALDLQSAKTTAATPRSADA